MGRPRSKEKSFINLYYRYKVDAKQKGVAFELSKEQFKFLTQSECRYCRGLPNKSSNKHMPEGTDDYVYNGIDRLDSSKGYVLENCVPCCSICNYMKRTMMPMEFLEHVYKIFKVHGDNIIKCLEERNAQSA